MPLFGSHLSIAGALANALREAESLAFDTVQVFTKNQRQWKVSPLKDPDADEWARELDRLGWRGRVVAHNSYLVNLASPDDALWTRSVDLQREEIVRAAALGITLLVSHPGAHSGAGVDAGISRIVSAYTRLLKETTGANVAICLENTVGAGSQLGGPFEHLASIRQGLLDALGDEAHRRVRFCFDTCHALAAGHDLRTENAANAALDRFDEVCGLSLIGAVHLNDSKGALGSHLDRHEHIGKGKVGLGAFRAVVNRPDLAGVPMILETPKEDSPSGAPWDTVNLRQLRRLLRSSSPAPKTRAPKPARPAKPAAKPRPAARKASRKRGPYSADAQG